MENRNAPVARAARLLQFRTVYHTTLAQYFFGKATPAQDRVSLALRTRASEETAPRRGDWPEGAIFTLGHSTLAIERFLTLVQTYGIECLVDIRTIPRSRHNPQFNDTQLRRSLTARNLEYLHMKALGGLRRPRKDSQNTGWRNESFRGYADYMQTEAFAAALEELIGVSRDARVGAMCAEAVPWRCHRSLVADALIVRGIPVIEILSQTDYRMHGLTPFAQVEGTRITYPPQQSTLLWPDRRYGPANPRRSVPA